VYSVRDAYAATHTQKSEPTNQRRTPRYALTAAAAYTHRSPNQPVPGGASPCLDDSGKSALQQRYKSIGSASLDSCSRCALGGQNRRHSKALCRGRTCAGVVDGLNEAALNRNDHRRGPQLADLEHAQVSSIARGHNARRNVSRDFSSCADPSL
jgi:hypothetical protein